ncbi:MULTISPECIES: siderophore-interacting protein [unclassified Curtobacterium]|uniref:siderophore-interacting protein n=1 Tax=unclassified Curtobacterium TaxID=257496 RepID=UPI0010502F83|nr:MULTISPECIES: siderophore-interacting protein [unclassified Curtobacterium]TCL81159.1 NADPH-dependent ferric siderophore reductase [Curtobacterium sp. PhB128]TCL99284.1 NADPH-dependent ferric siderophore reductase [Curtobacterium sp. PhB138]
MSSKPKRPQHVFVVDRTERLSPHMVRVHLGGPAFDDFVGTADPDKLAATDKYVKLLLAKPSLGLESPYDLEELRETLPKQDRPARRTYTVRAVDHTAKTIAVDFVVHGDDGLAGPWAAAAQPGDKLALSGPGGGYTPVDDPDVTHVLLGDDSALPAIGAALESMSDTATGVALVEVAGPADEQEIAHPAGVDLRWLHRDATGAQPGTLLLDAARALPRASRPVQVFAHGERTAMKAIRRLLQDDWGLEKREMSLSAYWALGRGEDQFQEEKREPVGVIFTD